MPTLRELCSDIQSELKANNIDDRYSYRFLISRMKDKIKNFIKQDADKRTLLRLADVWLTFPEVDLKEELLINFNVDIPDARTIMKSKKKIPKTFETNYGNLVRVFSLDGYNEYRLINRINYRDILNLEYRDKRVKYAWIEDDYLFIPDSNVEKVILSGLPVNPEEINCTKCSLPLDTVLPFPGYLIDIVKKDIIQEILGVERYPVDENPNLNTNIKT